MKKQQNQRAATGGQLRIIGGQWRGRKLRFPALDGLRPTGDRIRETLFNWLQLELPGARCLDLFAGSGALGLEALSRGCSHCTLVEQNGTAVQHLRANAALLAASTGQIEQADALHWLSRYQGPSFDLVFLDPPFGANLWQACIDLLEQGDRLASPSTIYLEMPVGLPLQTPANWQLHRDKTAGEVCYRLYHRL
jgi:16S rRNA (guanine966-N2)-methyltransferase